MRAILSFLFTLGLFLSVQADEFAPAAATRTAAAPAAKAGKVVKVLPLWLDQQGRIATSPSLFDRDAYQAYLREHTNEVSALRFDVSWSADKNGTEKLTLRAELRGVGEAGIPRLKNLETEVAPGRFGRWTSLTLGGEDFKQFGAVVAWRVTLWNGSHLLGSQQSFLW